MAFKRFRGRKVRKSFKRRSTGGWGSRFSNALNLAMKAYTMAKMVKSLVNVEKKYCDVTNNQTPGTSVAFDLLTGISEGSDYNQRTGISVKLASLYIRGTLELSGSAPVDTQVRIIIFRDQEYPQGSAGTIPSNNELLEVVNNINSPLTHSINGRMQILSDKVYSMANAVNQALHLKHYIKLNSHCKWASSTNNYRQGHIYVAYMVDNYSMGVSQVSFNYYSRVRYIDN